MAEAISPTSFQLKLFDPEILRTDTVYLGFFKCKIILLKGLRVAVIINHCHFFNDSIRVEAAIAHMKREAAKLYPSIMYFKMACLDKNNLPRNQVSATERIISELMAELVNFEGNIDIL
jgi:hypothetical protein